MEAQAGVDRGEGGMALLNTHPDYMALDGARRGREEYPAYHDTDSWSI
jgi:hypothetical protein